MPTGALAEAMGDTASEQHEQTVSNEAEPTSLVIDDELAERAAKEVLEGIEEELRKDDAEIARALFVAVVQAQAAAKRDADARATTAVAEVLVDVRNPMDVATAYATLGKRLGLEVLVAKMSADDSVDAAAENLLVWNLVKVDDLWYHVDVWSAVEDLNKQLEVQDHETYDQCLEAAVDEWLLRGKTAKDEYYAVPTQGLLIDGAEIDDADRASDDYQGEDTATVVGVAADSDADAGAAASSNAAAMTSVNDGSGSDDVDEAQQSPLTESAQNADDDDFELYEAGYCIRNISESQVSWNAGSNSAGTLPAAASPLYAGKQYYLNLQVTEDVKISKLVLTVNPPHASSFTYTFDIGSYARWAAYPYIFQKSGSGSYSWYLEYVGGGTDTFTNSFTVSNNPTSITATGYDGTYDGSSHSISCTVTGPSNYTLYYSTETSLDDDNYNTEGSTSKPYLSSGYASVYVYCKDNTGQYNNVAVGSFICIKPKVSVSSYSGTYDGKPHAPSVSCAGGKLYYRTSEAFAGDTLTQMIALRLSLGWSAESNGLLDAPPTQTDVGTLPIYWIAIPSEGSAVPYLDGVSGTQRYSVLTGSTSVTIAKASQAITASDKSVEAGKTVSLGAKSSGSGSLTYSTADSSIATVSSTGVVTGVAPGSTKVTIKAAATTNYNSATKTVTVTVTGGTQVITASDLTVAMGKTASIGATTSGNGALSYFSSNTSIAKVSAVGLVTPVSVGTANVTITAAATTSYPSATKTIKVTVTKGDQSITASNKTVEIGKTVALGAKTSGDGALTYQSGNTTVATVDGSGVVSGVTAGSAQVTITAAGTNNFNKATKTVTITVKKLSQTITASDKSVAMGATVSLGAKASGDGKLSYSSADTTVAKVSSSGVVTPVAVGSTKITISAAETNTYAAASKEVTITVGKGTPTITAGDVTVTSGKTTALNATTSGDGRLTYKSGNTAIATVSTSGVVTGVAEGETTITITAASTTNYNQATKTVKVTVTPQKVAQTITASDKSVEVGKTVSMGAKTSGDGKLTYQSSDERVAKVSSAGVISGVSSGKAKVTIKAAETDKYAEATKTITVTVTEPTKTGFVRGRDNWNFNNSSWEGYFEDSRYIDQIDKNYLDLLKDNLNEIEYEDVFGTFTWMDETIEYGYIYDEWGGSCYGMSATTLLAKEGLLPYAQYKTGASTLHALPTPVQSRAVSSLITYYQMLQVKDAIQQELNVGKSKKESITRILELLEKHDTVLVCYACDYWGHAVIAYDVEYGSYTWDGVTYQGRIRICDPNTSAEEDEEDYRECDIYFNPTTYNWVIPAYLDDEMSSTQSGVIDYVGADVTKINDGGYLKGTADSTRTSSFVARLDALSISGKRSITKVEKSSGSYVRKTSSPGDIVEAKSFVLGDKQEGTIGYNLYDADSAYRVTQNDSVELKLVMRYEDLLMKAGSAAGSNAVFDKSGYVEVNGESANYALSITQNSGYPTDWTSMSARGEGADKASLEVANDGYIIASDNLNNVSLEAHNKEVDADRTFSTSYPSAFIYEIDEHTIGIRVDTDNNGTYETDLGVEGKTPISSVTITPLGNQPYTGKAIEPSVTLMDGTTKLKLGTDYRVVYENNNAVGPATATIIGLGAYTGSTTIGFTIVKGSQTITASNKVVAVGKTVSLEAKTSGNGTLTYKSSNSSVATVNSSGVVTGVKVGKATIMVSAAATTNYAASTKTVTVTVTNGSKEWKRLWGQGSLDTAAAIVEEGWKDGCGGTVVVARNDDFKDALAGAGLAGISGGPIVLTSRDQLSSQAREQLVRLKPTRVFVAGGEGALKPAVVDGIAAATGLPVRDANSSSTTGIIRLWGSGSPQTSAALATAGRGGWSDATAIIATNGSFKDALSAAPISYAKHWPILLASSGAELAPEVIAALKGLGITQAYIMGGTGAVKPYVETQLKAAGIEVAGRKAGYWGWETSREIANWGLTLGLSADGMGYATSQRFPDALAGAALLGKNGSVLLLADQQTQGNLQFAKNHAAEIARGYVFGGTGAFSAECYDQLPK